MKRISLLLILLILLTSCTSNDLGAGFKAGLEKPNISSTNHKKPYYRYYVPPHVGVKKTDKTSSLLDIQGHQVLLSLSVDKIVSTKFDYEMSDDKVKIKEPDFQDSASYIDINDASHKMSIRIYKLKNKNYAIFLNNEQVEFTAIVPLSALKIATDTMVSMLKSVVVDTEKVVLAYSTKEISTYDSTYSEFFEQTPPEAGTIKDMYEQLNPKKD